LSRGRRAIASARTHQSGRELRDRAERVRDADELVRLDVEPADCREEAPPDEQRVPRRDRVVARAREHSRAPEQPGRRDERWQRRGHRADPERHARGEARRARELHAAASKQQRWAGDGHAQWFREGP
jgi:hypothetical protein